MSPKDKKAIEAIKSWVVDDGFQGTTTVVLASADWRARRRYISLSTAMHGHGPLPLRTTDATSVPMGSIGTTVVGSVTTTEEDDTLHATAEVGPPPHERPESCAELLKQGITPESMKRADGPRRPPIAMPHGYVMGRIASSVFFFARSMPRAVEESVGDYRNEMTDAEGRGRSPSELRILRVKHWGGFVLCVIDAILTGIIGRIWRALRGG